jgi:NitT/TauT family transport system permease protein
MAEKPAVSRRARGARLAIWLSLVAAWELAPRLGAVSPLILPPFSVVAVRTLHLVTLPATLHAFGVTLALAALAFALALAAGLALGLVIGANRFAEAVIDPFAATLASTPKSMFLPLFILVLGFGYRTEVLFSVLYGFFPIFLTTVAGIRQVKRTLVTKARSLGASRRQIYTKVILPSIVPTVFSGVRIGLNFTLLGVLLVEMIAPESGIGRLMVIARDTLDARDLMSYILVTALIAMLLNRWLLAGEERLSRWRT